MSDKKRKWDASPPKYNDDRFVEAAHAASDGLADDQEERSAGDVEALLSRPSRERGSSREYECNDTTPLNYARGPHNDEFGVDDADVLDPDSVPYEQGPHDDEFGVDDDELEPVDDEEDSSA